jgi:acyl-CoA synthetase (AMP-forming)/AMP-acid ligase II
LDTIWQLVQQGDPRAAAVNALDRKPLTYGGLREHAARVVESLNRAGIGRNDRVALLLPNGPEMATAFVSISSGASTAPLNPAFRPAELEFYLADLKAKALVVAAGAEAPAVEVAARLGLAIFELRIAPAAPAGAFELAMVRKATADPERTLEKGCAASDDVALLLHTSGTTARPKLVPLTQRNLCTSARHIAESLQLTPADRCLNIMPLFHIHGLMAAVLATLSAGASVACTPGFNAFKFFSWLQETRPTWYTAVPTMHQAILSRADRNMDALRASRLRFIRSCSSSLAPRFMSELEAVFAVPVIESYGMTEAAHQIATNPLPPQPRKAGTVGLPAGLDVAIVGAEGNELASEEVGEVVVRGPSVMKGYEKNPKANDEAFINGWFRTGDQGVFDRDGYLRLTGRLKEIINRGGEKISPREVDEALLEHPSVAQAVTFAMPHDKLGEEVAAAVVLRAGFDATPSEICRFVGERLADFKVPRRVVILDEIPKGPTGKPQRIGLAEKLGLTG